jgi:hypothetical protein
MPMGEKARSSWRWRRPENSGGFTLAGKKKLAQQFPQKIGRLLP